MTDSTPVDTRPWRTRVACPSAGRHRSRWIRWPGKFFPALTAFFDQHCVAAEHAAAVGGLDQPVYDQLAHLKHDLDPKLADAPDAELAAEAGRIWDSEVNRSNALDSKASSYLVGIVLAMGVLSFLVDLAGDEGAVPGAVKAIFALTMLHLFIATLSAIWMRRARGFTLPSVGQAVDFAERGWVSPHDAAILMMARAKWNYFPLRKKAGWLAAAEGHFFWGVLLIAVGSAFVFFPGLLPALADTAGDLVNAAERAIRRN